MIIYYKLHKETYQKTINSLDQFGFPDNEFSLILDDDFNMLKSLVESKKFGLL